MVVGVALTPTPLDQPLPSLHQTLKHHQTLSLPKMSDECQVRLSMQHLQGLEPGRVRSPQSRELTINGCSLNEQTVWWYTPALARRCLSVDAKHEVDPEHKGWCNSCGALDEGVPMLRVKFKKRQCRMSM